MRPEIDAILKLEVPIIVLIGEHDLPVDHVLSLTPGSIIELPKGSDEELELLVNNKPIGVGQAVKVGENFGIKITAIGDARARLEAMKASPADDGPSDDEAEAMADQMLAGQ